MKREVQDDHSCLGSYELLPRENELGRERETEREIERQREREGDGSLARNVYTQREDTDTYVRNTHAYSAPGARSKTRTGRKDGRIDARTDGRTRHTVELRTNERTVVRVMTFHLAASDYSRRIINRVAFSFSLR